MQSSEDRQNTVEKICLLSRDEAVGTQCKRNCLREGIKERDWRRRADLCSAAFQKTRAMRGKGQTQCTVPLMLSN